MLKRYDEAIECARRSQQLGGQAIFANLAEVSALGWTGSGAQIQDASARMLKVKPDVSISYITKVLPMTDETTREHFLGGLRKAGVPE